MERSLHGNLPPEKVSVDFSHRLRLSSCWSLFFETTWTLFGVPNMILYSEGKIVYLGLAWPYI